MAIRSVDEIINLSDSSTNPEKLAFKDLVKHIDPRIRGRAPRHNSLNFKIPGILWGQPVFDADKVEKMIVHHYRKIGFKCVRLAKRELLIQWGEGEGEEESNDTDSADSTESSDTGTSEAAESTASTASASTAPTDSTDSSDSADSADSSDSSDSDDSTENKTKCVTVEQMPLSKRLSIVNNQLQQK